MPSFKGLTSISGRNNCSLFDIRLNDDFIVFRGGEQESSGQLLKGVVVLCIIAPLRIEDVHLRLTGTLRMHWGDGPSTPTVTINQKFDKTTTILDHRWAPFVGTPGKSMILPVGNYEYPFEYTMSGKTAESVEGIPEASITYRLKATVRRGKISPDLHTYKHLRVIRTLEPSALEFLHAMSVENIWPNKLEYSIVIPRKAVIFGGVVDLELRCTPLLKALELGSITAKLIEIRECRVAGTTGVIIREHRREREVSKWSFEVNREEHWHDMIENTGQEGWIVKKSLNLPRKLAQCVQDVDLHGVKVRHKIKLTIVLQNPDGHQSELRATLPVSIFISPNIPFDEDGNLLSQLPMGSANAEQELGLYAPPGYGEHVLDQLYDELDVGGYQTPVLHSGVTSPFYGQSRAGSTDNLTAIAHSAPIAPAALVSRLTDVSLDQSQRSSSHFSLQSLSPGESPGATSQGGAGRYEPSTSHLSRTSSEEEGSKRSSADCTQADETDLAALSRVPSYATAVRTPARSRAGTGAGAVPDYQTALSAPRTPPAADTGLDYLSPIMEHSSGPDPDATQPGAAQPPSSQSRAPQQPSSQTRASAPAPAPSNSDDAAARARLHLARARDTSN